MKLKISTFILGVFMMSFSLNSSSTVNAQDIKDAAYLTTAVYYGVKTVFEVDSNCQDKKENGNLKDRCKNNKCGPVACISFRPTCSNPGEPC